MQWYCLQTERAGWIRWYNSVTGLVVQLVGWVVGVTGLILLLASLLVQLPTVVLALSLAGLGVGLATASTLIYVNFVKANPRFLISDQAIKANPLNGCDFPVIEVLGRWKNTKDWLALWQGLARQPEAAMVMYRLGLNGQTIAQTLPGRLVGSLPSSFSKAWASANSVISKRINRDSLPK